MSDNGLTHEIYLGDGLYTGFDGYQIILAANGRLGTEYCSDKVALDPHVTEAFIKYVKRLREAGEPI